MAKSVQARFEEVANRQLHKLYHKTQLDYLALAGGCSHNSVWVGQIPKNTPFKEVLVAPASHDAGISVGAAISATGHWVAVERAHWALTGPSPSKQTRDPIPSDAKLNRKDFETEENLASWLANELSQGKIAGLYRGPMEFGPRALGNRSIIADPRSASMRDRLNIRVKHRETFRPFAASVLWEKQGDWFEDSFYAPTMEAVFTVRKEARDKIAAVCHADNTCRIQSVTRETQSFYWSLIDNFRKITGVPMLINTSFNDSEPIVCSETDAIRCFLESDLDHLVIENRVYTKTKQVSKVALTG